jgi:flagellar biosynthesis protein FlhB
MAEKSEKATPKKIRDARKKGQVAKSQDFPAAFTFIISIAGALAMSSQIYESLSTFTISLFKSVANSPDLKIGLGGF